MKKAGAKSVRMVCVVAAPEGVDVLERDHPDVDVFTASVDRELNDTAYIMPGLGDFGDRLYGTLDNLDPSDGEYAVLAPRTLHLLVDRVLQRPGNDQTECRRDRSGRR